MKEIKQQNIVNFVDSFLVGETELWVSETCVWCMCVSEWCKSTLYVCVCMCVSEWCKSTLCVCVV